ncbi:NAD-P-binding protein [Laetiporus sulphureus 93-53]|uniref:NAD-P-binding protein n=1 Tax=Laetiporus sulphureus 93-53 TaxID=1314785 RepID=A0A165EH82_9APHY|nr:NAD-P-binding protein [Laetiporus sulphureus 93-53]KZT07048.1 NAD-P-binding protein [Laetiporus sulphureus 93-53]
MAEAVLEQLSASAIFDLRGVVAVVTGGLMISSTLMANGATVYIIGPKQADLDKIANVYNEGAKKTNRPGRIYGIEGDIRRKSEALRLAEEVGKREKHVTVLFNNAGILASAFTEPTAKTAEAFRAAYFDTVSEGDFINSLETNAVGPFWLTFAFLPLLEKWKEYEGGTRRFAPQIIMTSSMNGWTKDPRTASCSFPYIFSKSAIGHATSSLAHELLPLGIRVNGIAPGLFPTEMSAPGTINPLGISHIPSELHFPFEVPTSQPPLTPGGPPLHAGTRRDMGSLALFLVANWYVNGETVLIDGGTLLKHPSSY